MTKAIVRNVVWTERGGFWRVRTLKHINGGAHAVIGGNFVSYNDIVWC